MAASESTASEVLATAHAAAHVNTATAAAVSRRAGGRRRDWSQAMSAVAAAAAVLLKLLSIVISYDPLWAYLNAPEHCTRRYAANTMIQSFFEVTEGDRDNVRPCGRIQPSISRRDSRISKSVTHGWSVFGGPTMLTRMGKRFA